jgi:hypothetical protein
MICPICSLYFQDVEQEAFRHHALLSHHSAAMMQALGGSDVKPVRHAEPAVADAQPLTPKTDQ